VLKSKIKTLKKEVPRKYPIGPTNKEYKYTLNDWTHEEIRHFVFPEGREIFDPNDKTLIEKWEKTDWKYRNVLERLSVEELKRLERVFANA
jgi:hypothetical protein